MKSLNPPANMKGNEKMKENINKNMSFEEILNSNISIKDTSRGLYEDKSLDYFEKLEQKKKARKNNIVENIGASKPEQVYYIAKENNYAGKLYEVDSYGNLIEEYQFNSNVITNAIGENVTDDEKIKKLVQTYTKQINLLKEQEELKEEINGYPELNEAYRKLLKPLTVKTAFSNTKSTLRALMYENGSKDCKVLLSLLHYNMKDELFNLINKNIIKQDNYLKGKIIRGILSYNNRYKTIPNIQEICEYIKLPYSKEFFDEYVMSKNNLQTELDERYEETKKRVINELLFNASKYKLKLNDLCREAKNINLKYTRKIETTIPDNFNILKSKLLEKNEKVLLSTGIDELDEENVFLQKGKVATVVAYTGDFKTMFSTNVAYNNIKSGNNVLYLSLEISKEDMYYNFLSRHSYNNDKKLSHSDLKVNRLSEDDYKIFDMVYEDFKSNLKSHLIIVDGNDISQYTYKCLDTILSIAEEQFIRTTGKGIDLLIVDHLNLFKFSSKSNTNAYAVVNDWMSYFRKKSLNFLNTKKEIATLCVCQSSREGYKQALKDKRYSLTSIAEGNEIERSSSLVLSIFTDTELKENNEVFMQVLKLRDEAQKELSSNIKVDPKYYTFGVKGKNVIQSNNVIYERQEKNIQKLEVL